MMLIMFDHICILDQNPDCIDDLGIRFRARICAYIYATVHIADLVLLFWAPNDLLGRASVLMMQ